MGCKKRKMYIIFLLSLSLKVWNRMGYWNVIGLQSRLPGSESLSVNEQIREDLEATEICCFWNLVANEIYRFWNLVANGMCHFWNLEANEMSFLKPGGNGEMSFLKLEGDWDMSFLKLGGNRDMSFLKRMMWILWTSKVTDSICLKKGQWK